MTSRSTRGRLLASTLFASVATFAVPAAVAVIGTMAATSATAQDYTSGTLAGTVESTTGEPVSGATVTIRSVAQGVTRTITTGENGEFRLPLITTGEYNVSISAPGFEPANDRRVAVRLGGESTYSFTLSRPGEVSELVVTGTVNPQLDFSQTTTGLTVDVETLQKQVPIARNITAVTLLAPGATEGSSTNFRGLTSLSGASVAENAFYINGLNITNFDNYLGASTVPFDFYKTVEVKTGGYSAEFGRATGGIVNAVTKSGTNDFFFGVHGNWSPEELEADQRDTYQRRGRLRTTDNADITFEAGGPIIRDRLFAYGLVQLRDNTSTIGSINTSQYITDKSDDPFYGLKLDGYITATQHLEFTYFDTSRETVRSARQYTFDEANDTDTIGVELPGTVFREGGESYVAKYTGTFTDWLTVSAAYGKNKDSNETLSALGDAPLVQSVMAAGPNNSSATRRVSFQNSATQDAPRTTEREFFRGDVDIYFDLMGAHHIRAGFDREDLSLTHISQRNGNANYVYRRGSASNAIGITDPTRIYLEARTFIGGGSYDARNQAVYIQDSWDVLENLTLNLGIRRDQFQVRGINLNGVQGDTFVDFDNEIAPRLGVVFDPGNDGRNKIFANYGRYYLPVASNTAYRQASAILDETAYFLMPVGFQVYQPGTLNINTTYVDATTGLPVAGLAGTQYVHSSLTPCLPGGVGTAGVESCTIRNNGEVQPFISNTSRNLKSTAEDEYLVGWEHKLNDLWTVGATLTWRKSIRAADDVAVDQAVVAFCQREGIAGCDEIYTGFHQYTIINPGEPSTIVLTDPLPGETSVRTISFSAADLGYPKVDREYLALQLQFERAWDGKWGLQGSYTISQSKGNYEGYVKTDYAGGQTDAGITADFDTPGLTQGAHGLLPNHRGHVIKLYGSYQLTDNLLVGANTLISSGRKYGCMGLNPNDPILNASYGALSHWCFGEMTPRGTVFSDPWTYRLDLSFRYTVPSFGFLPEKGLVLRADVFNLFNSRKAIESDEFGETDSGTINTHFKDPLAFQNPRSVRLGFDLVF